MNYSLLYHPDVAKRDIPTLSHSVREEIARRIETRLTQAPELYGLPLRGTLKGYWKLRVRDYRVVYKIVSHEIWILGILHRSRIYKEATQRIGWHP